MMKNNTELLNETNEETNEETMEVTEEEEYRRIKAKTHLDKIRNVMNEIKIGENYIYYRRCEVDKIIEEHFTGFQNLTKSVTSDHVLLEFLVDSFLCGILSFLQQKVQLSYFKNNDGDEECTCVYLFTEKLLKEFYDLLEVSKNVIVERTLA